MPAKAKPKAAATPCSVDQEVTPVELHLHTDDVVDLEVRVCNASATIRVLLDDQVLLPPTPVVKPVKLSLGQLAPGSYVLAWALWGMTTGTWAVRSEVKINGLTRFLHAKSNASTEPLAKWRLPLEVYEALS